MTFLQTSDDYQRIDISFYAGADMSTPGQHRFRVYLVVHPKREIKMAVTVGLQGWEFITENTKTRKKENTHASTQTRTKTRKHARKHALVQESNKQ